MHYGSVGTLASPSSTLSASWQPRSKQSSSTIVSHAHGVRCYHRSKAAGRSDRELNPWAKISLLFFLNQFVQLFCCSNRNIGTEERLRQWSRGTGNYKDCSRLSRLQELLRLLSNTHYFPTLSPRKLRSCLKPPSDLFPFFELGPNSCTLILLPHCFLLTQQPMVFSLTPEW